MPQVQVSLLNTVSLSEFTDLVERNFLLNMQMIKPVAAQLYIHEDLTGHTGDRKRYNEVDVNDYAKLMREGANAQKTTVGIGYSKDMIAKRVAIEIDITWNMRRYNKKPEIVAALHNLSHFCNNREDLDLTHRLTFCNASSYTDMDGETIDVTGGDGLPIVYSTHTLVYSSTTWRNRVSGDPAFSKSALESALQLTVTDILNNFGQRRTMNFNTIITGDDPTTVNAVKQHLNSTTDVTQSNPGVINVMTGMQHVILPRLATTATGAHDSTKRRWWFIAATGQGLFGWQAFHGVWEDTNLKVPKEGNNGEDIHNDNWTYGARRSYGIAVVTGRGLVGSLPTS